MPVAAEVGGFVLFLHHLENVGVALQPGDEGIEAGLAEAPADAHQVGRLERLVAKHQHGVAQERALDGLPGPPVVQRRKLDAADFSSQRASQRLDYHRASL